MKTYSSGRLAEVISKKTILDCKQNQILLIDPGLANLCITSPSHKIAYLLHFKSLIEIENSPVFDELVELRSICDNL